MNKPRLIKRGAVPQPSQPKTMQQVSPAVTLHKTMNVVKEWIGTRHANNKQNAREAFSRLFAQAQEHCTEC